MKKNIATQTKIPEYFIDDPLTAIVRQGARDILARALEMEIDEFMDQYTDLKDSQGRQRITRNGYLPEREIQTGVGPVPVKVPRSRDRQKNSQIKFASVHPLYRHI